MTAEVELCCDIEMWLFTRSKLPFWILEAEPSTVSWKTNTKTKKKTKTQTNNTASILEGGPAFHRILINIRPAKEFRKYLIEVGRKDRWKELNWEKNCHELKTLTTRKSIFQIIVPNMGEEEILHVLADKNTIYRFEMDNSFHFLEDVLFCLVLLKIFSHLYFAD